MPPHAAAFAWSLATSACACDLACRPANAWEARVDRNVWVYVHYTAKARDQFVNMVMVALAKETFKRNLQVKSTAAYNWDNRNLIDVVRGLIMLRASSLWHNRLVYFLANRQASNTICNL